MNGASARRLFCIALSVGRFWRCSSAVESGTSLVKVGAKCELAPDYVESATWRRIRTLENCSSEASRVYQWPPSMSSPLASLKQNALATTTVSILVLEYYQSINGTRLCRVLYKLGKGRRQI